MKKSILAVAVIATALLSSCGTTAGSALGTVASAVAQNYVNGNTNSTTTANTTSSTSSNVLSSLVSGATSSTGLLGSILGAFTSTTNANTITGTWTYQQPSIQFESSNLLAQAGGSIASNTIVNKITPYYEKVGLKAGVAQLTLNTDNSCAITLSSKTINGTYTYDTSAGTITVNGLTGLKLFTAYVSVSGSQLSLTMDTSNLLTMLQNAGSSSTNSTLSTVSSISKSFSGMKTGFLFTK